MDFLQKLGVQANNAGAWSGAGWTSRVHQTMLHSENPADGQIIAKVSGCSPADYETVVVRAAKAFEQWRQVPAPQRGELIRLIGERLRAEKQSLSLLIATEMGKSIQEAEGEVQEMIDMADFAVGQSRMLYGVMMHSERVCHRMYEQWHPYGVVGVITAFNFPVAVWAWNAFIAAVAGNVVIWKPSSSVPLCAIAVHQLCCKVLKEQQAPDIFSLIIPAHIETTQALVDDKRVPLISFTGSTAVGRQVAQRVAARLGRTILELGGNNAMIMAPSADRPMAIPAIVFAAIGTTGQRCTTMRRLFVHESIYDDVLSSLRDAYQQITIGPALEGHLMGPLIDAKAVFAYQQAIADVQAAGGQLAFGGQVLSRVGYFVEPTIVTDLNPDHALIQQETFAPILYVFSYQTLHAAIAAQNAVPQGLSSALFTNDLREAEYFLSAMGSDCGIANINMGTSGAEIGGAFGGEKETGGGREAGSDAWKAYMRRQTTTVNWGHTLPLAQGILFQ